MSSGASSSVLALRIPGMEEPGGLLSMGSHGVRHNRSDLAAAAAAAAVGQPETERASPPPALGWPGTRGKERRPAEVLTAALFSLHHPCLLTLAQSCPSLAVASYWDYGKKAEWPHPETASLPWVGGYQSQAAIPGCYCLVLTIEPI